MVFHVGIDVKKGDVAVYNDIIKRTRYFKLKIILPSDINGVDAMFEKIKKNIGGDLGCCCICLESDFGNEIRKQFVKCGKQSGFKKTQIIDYHSAKYLGFVSKVDCEIQEDDIVWIFYGNCCDVWKKTKTSADLVKCLTEFDGSTTKGLMEIKLKSGINKEPSVIFCLKNSDIIKIAFPKSECFDFYIGYHDAALTKARIMAKDSDVLKYRVDILLDTEFIIESDGNEMHSISKYQSLPFKEIIHQVVEKGEEIKLIHKHRSKDNVLEKTLETCSMEFHKVYIKLEVDKNRIYNLEYIPYFTITIFDNKVFLFNNKTEELKTFPAAIDYGVTPPKFGVDYKSPTVIDYQKENNLVKTKIVSDLDVTKFYYIMTSKNGSEHFIEETKFLADLFQELLKVINIEQPENVVAIFTIPFYFSEEKRENYEKAISKAGFDDYAIDDEEFALSDGFEMHFNIKNESRYIMIHVVGENTCILSKEDSTIYLDFKTFDTIFLKEYKDSWFENIIESIDESNEKLSTEIEMIFEHIEEILNEQDNIHFVIAVTCHRLLYTFLKDRFPNITNIIFIEDSAELIVKNGDFDRYNNDSSNNSDDEEEEDDDDDV